MPYASALSNSTGYRRWENRFQAHDIICLYAWIDGLVRFDLATALKNPAVNPHRIITAFSEYMDRSGHHVPRELFEQNLALKLDDPLFTADIGPLLAPGYSWDIADAAKAVASRLIALLPEKA